MYYARLDAEGAQRPHEDEVQLPRRQDMRRAHAVAQAEGEDGRVGVLDPALGPEDLWVGPELAVCDCSLVAASGQGGGQLA